jgi:hypothetical protein
MEAIEFSFLLPPELIHGCHSIPGTIYEINTAKVIIALLFVLFFYLVVPPEELRCRVIPFFTPT